MIDLNLIKLNIRYDSISYPYLWKIVRIDGIPAVQGLHMTLKTASMRAEILLRALTLKH